MEANQPDNKTYYLHWVDYLILIPFLLIALLLITLFVATLVEESSFSIPSFIGSLVFIAFSIVGFLNRKVYKVYTDENGVWVSGGIFPWSKGTYGLNWRDISDAVYYTGFISWFLKSYKLVIQHRYTKSSELVLKNIKNGDQLVQEINKKVKELNLY